MSVNPEPRPGIVIINDSAVAGTVAAAVVRADGGFRLLGEAHGGVDGVELVCRLRPRLVSLDMHMPDIDGIEVRRRIMIECATRIMVTSATIRSNTRYLFDALAQGALDQMTLTARALISERPRREPHRTLRILSPPCARGEEPYSIAMLLAEHQGAEAAVEIVGVETCLSCLCDARRGRRGPPALYRTSPEPRR